MKRRVIFEIMAVVAISVALGGGAIWASRDGGGQKETTTGVSGFPAPTDWATPDPNNMQPIPGRHFVGAHQCNVPRVAREVSVPQATSKGGRALDNGLDRYYLTASGRCVTIADDTRETRDWIPMELEARLEDPKDIIWPCQIPDQAVEVLTEEAARKGGRVFDFGTSRTFVGADGHCVTLSGALSGVNPPPDWVDWTPTDLQTPQP